MQSYQGRKFFKHLKAIRPLAFGLGLTFMFFLCSPAVLNAKNYSSALASYQLGDFKKARSTLIRIVDKGSANSRAKSLKLLGIVNFHLGNRGGASDAFRKAIKLDPNISISQAEVLDPNVIRFFESVKSTSTRRKIPIVKNTPRPSPARPTRTARTQSRPKPIPTTLIVKSNVRSASVLLDGILAGKQGQKIDVSPGNKKIVISARGYQSRSLNVAIRKNQPNEVRVELVKIKPKPRKSKRPSQTVAKSRKKPRSSTPDLFAEGPSGNQLAGRDLTREFEADRISQPPVQTRPQRTSPRRNQNLNLNQARQNRRSQPVPTQQPQPNRQFQQPYGQAPIQQQPGSFPAQQPYYQQPPVYNQPPAYPQQPVYQQPPPVYQQPYPQPAYPVQQQPAPTYEVPEPPPPPPPPSYNDTGSDRSFVRKPRKRKRSKKQKPGSLALAIMPFGVGQFQNGDMLLGTLFAGAQAGSIAYYFIANSEADATVDQTNQELADRSNQANTAEEQKQLRQFEEDRKSYVDSKRQEGNLALVAFGALWAAGAVEAVLSMPKPAAKPRRRSQTVKPHNNIQLTDVMRPTYSSGFSLMPAPDNSLAVAWNVKVDF